MRYLVYFVLIIFTLHFLHEDSYEQALVRYSSQMDTVCPDSSLVGRWMRLLEANGIKYPIVPLAQATWETNYFRSKICRDNKNLFGMKYSSRGFARGRKHGHAYYENALQSVKDYAAWQKRCLALRPDIHSEEEYIQMLDNLPTCKGCRYAEDTTYTTKIRKRIKDIRQW